MQISTKIFSLSLLLFFSNAFLFTADWPMWRFDAGHGGASPEQLPENLTLKWHLQFTEREQVWDDPLNNDLMQYDRLFEPIVANKLVYLAFNDRDKVVAYDLKTAQQRWQFFCNGPVRFPPVAWEGNLYVASDDGNLYCLNALDGSVRWTFNAAPAQRAIIGNKRVISTWPLRGAPVIKDGTLYCAASIWPFMGTFFYALDAKTGSVIWKNDGMGAQYLKQPHSAPSFAGVAPQGIFSATEKYLVIPGGRSFPAVFDRATGQQLHFRHGGKGFGGSFVVANEKKFYVHTRYRQVAPADLKTGKIDSVRIREPVLDGGMVYAYVPEQGLQAMNTDQQVFWKINNITEYGDMIKAGNNLYVATHDKLKVVYVPKPPESTVFVPKQSKWSYLAGSIPDGAAWRTGKGTDTWKNGMGGFGFGDGDDRTLLKDMYDNYSSVYIYKQFTIDNAKSIKNLNVSALYDDAFILYINGKEILRKGVKSGSGKTAKGILNHEATTYESFKIDASVLRDGNNSIAVEGHNGGLQSSDFSLDVELFALKGTVDETDVAKVVKTMPLPSDVERLVAADGHLLAVTVDGGIYCYGAGPGRSKPIEETLAKVPTTQDTLSFLQSDEAGHVLLYAPESADTIFELVKQTKFKILTVENEKDKVDTLRAQCDQSGLYGKRVQIINGNLNSLQTPQYFAKYILTDKTRLNDRELKRMHASLRPYGGIWLVPVAANVDNKILAFEQMKKVALKGLPSKYAAYQRVGALPGSDDWTHHNGNVANTLKSSDKRVKLPLGVLWFGGSSNLDVLPRHGHGPSEQVIGGRLYIEGMDKISARDVYTGQVLWKREFDDLNIEGLYFDHTYKDTPLSTAYNQVHIPGANARGTNFIATEDLVYVVAGDKCRIIDALSGKDHSIITLPQSGGKKTDWAYIGVYENYLIAGVEFGNFYKKSKTEVEQKRKSWAHATDQSASMGLHVYDRHSGKLLWQDKAEYSFLHNGIIAGDGKLFCLDRYPVSYEKIQQRLGKDIEKRYRVCAFDMKTGKKVWEHRGHVFGTWLSYSAKHDLVFQGGARASDRLRDEVGQGMQTLHADSGKEKWYKGDIKYTGPCILHNDIIFTGYNSYSKSAGVYRLLDGGEAFFTNPLTGKKEPWKMSRAYGCNTIIASEHLLTFRSGAAGFYDLEKKSGTGNFGGFKSSCTSNLVVANGVLNAPDYTRTCSCSYQNQTSLALVHMPDVEVWTASHFAKKDLPTDPLSNTTDIDKIGINFAAPGDRIDNKNILWLDYPSVGGYSPPIGIMMDESAQTLRQHSSAIASEDYKWVAASAVKNVQSIKIQLGKTKRKYRVRLFFAELEGKKLGQRIFDVLLQGKPIKKKYDISKEAKSANTLHILEATCEVDKELHLQLKSVTGETLINGIEITAL